MTQNCEKNSMKLALPMTQNCEEKKIYIYQAIKFNYKPLLIWTFNLVRHIIHFDSKLSCSRFHLKWLIPINFPHLIKNSWFISPILVYIMWNFGGTSYNILPLNERQSIIPLKLVICMCLYPSIITFSQMNSSSWSEYISIG